MKLLGKWYKCQAERTKNELRGDFDLSRRENPGKTMMPILHWLCADPTKLVIKASLEKEESMNSTIKDHGVTLSSASHQGGTRSACA